MGLAVKFSEAQKITDLARDEVIEIVRTAPFSEWRPLLYLIPHTEDLRPRIKDVPYNRRAGRELEYIVEDLKPEEFHVIEFPS